MNFIPHLMPFIKAKSKLIIHLTLEAKTIKLTEENKGKDIQNPEAVKIFYMGHTLIKGKEIQQHMDI